MIIIKPERDLSNTTKYKTVLELIRKERKTRGIEKKDLKGTVSTWEASCCALGEAYNLVERHLMYGDEDFHLEWKLLKKSPDALNLAYNYLIFGSREGKIL